MFVFYSTGSASEHKNLLGGFGLFGEPAFKANLPSFGLEVDMNLLVRFLHRVETLTGKHRNG